MNPKLLFVIMLGIAAAGYYVYDPELTHLNKLTESTTGKASPARAGKAKTVKAGKARHKEAAVEPAPEGDAAPTAAEPAPEAAPEPAPAAESPAKPELAPAGSARVADVLAELPLVNDATPNVEARYYIYLMSAGWCGPCNMEMPNVVKAYEEIRKMGVAEIVLVDFDDSPGDALAYMNKYGATFPAIMKDEAPALPGMMPPSGIPFACIVDEMGNEVVRGHGSLISQWKNHISAYEEKKGLPSSLAEAESSATGEPEKADEPEADKKKQAKVRASSKAAQNEVARSAAKVKWALGRPSKKAEYYIYLQSASWCGPCRAEMPQIAEEYKAMKKDGRVELLLISFDQTEDDAEKFLKENKAKFPMTLKTAKGVESLAGFSMAQGIPQAIIVDASGRVITQGHGSLIRNWRQYTIDKEDAQ